MDKKSQVLVVIFAVIFTTSIVLTFYRYIVLKDIKYATDEDAFSASLAEEGEGYEFQQDLPQEIDITNQ